MAQSYLTISVTVVYAPASLKSTAEFIRLGLIRSGEDSVEDRHPCLGCFSFPTENIIRLFSLTWMYGVCRPIRVLTCSLHAESMRVLG